MIGAETVKDLHMKVCVAIQATSLGVAAFEKRYNLGRELR
jgi:hypothetical protein